MASWRLSLAGIGLLILVGGVWALLREPQASRGLEQAQALLGEPYAEWLNAQQASPQAPTSMRSHDANGGNLTLGSEAQPWAGAVVETQGGEPAFVLDFGELVLGTPVFAFTSVSGGDVLLTYYDEVDGKPYAPLTQTTGFSLLPGEQTKTDDPRLFRYLEVRFRNHPGATTLQRVELTNERRHAARGFFRTSSEDLNAAWRAGVRAADLSWATTLIDSPHRDNATWIGDARETGLVAQYAFGDPEPMRQTIEAFANRVRPDGALVAVVGLSPDNHEDWIFLDYLSRFVTLLREHYAFYGDRELLRQYAALAYQQLDYVQQYVDERGLLVVPGGLAPSNDWASSQRTGAVAYQQLVYIQGLRDGAAIAQATGDDDRATSLEDRASMSQDATAKYLTDPDTGLLYDFEPNAAEAPRLPLDANVLAFLDPAWPAQDGQAADERLAKLRQRLESPYGWRSLDGPYQSLDVRYNIAPLRNAEAVASLLEANQVDDAIDLVRAHWGQMRSAGASSTWEFMGIDGSIAGSVSHGWSGKISYVLQHHLLGFSVTAPGARSVSVAPRLGELEFVEGAVPTPRGVVAARVERTEFGAAVQVSVPRGITLTVVPPIQKQTLALDDTALPPNVTPNDDGMVVLSGGKTYRLEYRR